MNLVTSLQALAHDAKLQAVLILIALDVVLGSAAAFKAGTFRLAYLADFAKTDVLGKVVPWAALYVVAKLAPAADLLGFSLSNAADVLWGAVGLALIGSLVSSIRDLTGIILPSAVAGGEKPPPGP